MEKRSAGSSMWRGYIVKAIPPQIVFFLVQYVTHGMFVVSAYLTSVLWKIECRLILVISSQNNGEQQDDCSVIGRWMLQLLTWRLVLHLFVYVHRTMPSHCYELWTPVVARVNESTLFCRCFFQTKFSHSLSNFCHKKPLQPKQKSSYWHCLMCSRKK